MNRILTIGIPTYNRAHSLKKSLLELSSSIGSYADYIEIIISDNCSTDDTERVVKEWMEIIPSGLSIRYHKNDSNIGISKNLVSLFYYAKTPYFMFIGDDDRIENLPRIIDVLKSDSAPSAIVCGFWNKRLRVSRIGYVSFEETAKLFYEYGNAWAAVVDTQAAVQAIESRELREEIEKIVWPHTVMGFLAMYDLAPRKVFITDFEMGARLGDGLNVTNKAYWIKSLYGLAKAASIIDVAISTNVFRRDLIASSAFKSHFRAILWYSLIADYKASTSDLEDLLLREYGVAGFFWAQLARLSHHPTLLRSCVFLLSLLRALLKGRWRSLFAFSKKMEVAKENHRLAVEEATQNHKRYGDWF